MATLVDNKGMKHVGEYGHDTPALPTFLMRHVGDIAVHFFSHVYLLDSKRGYAGTGILLKLKNGKREKDIVISPVLSESDRVISEAFSIVDNRVQPYDFEEGDEFYDTPRDINRRQRTISHIVDIVYTVLGRSFNTDRTAILSSQDSGIAIMTARGVVYEDTMKPDALDFINGRPTNLTAMSVEDFASLFPGIYTLFDFSPSLKRKKSNV